MADGLSIDDSPETLGVFECPNCNETIDTSADVCRFCGAKIDHEAAQKASQILARVDEACSDASYLRNTGVVAFALLAGVAYVLLRNGRLIERVGFRNISLGFCVLVVVVSAPFPIWSLSWWKKSANLNSKDDDFQNARKIVQSTGYTAFAAFAASCSLLLLIFAFTSAH